MPNPIRDAAQVRRREVFGSPRFPVRSSGDMLTNTPQLMWIGSSSVEDLPAALSADMIAPVERATGLIVGNLVGMPWRVYRGSVSDPSAAERIPTPLWVNDPMLLGSSPGTVQAARPLLDRRPQGSVFAEWIRLALWFGRGYLAYQPAADGQPLAGTVRNLANNMIGQDTDGRWVLHTDGQDIPITDAGDIVGTGYRVMALDEPLGDGRGVIGRHAETLRLTVHVRGYASSTFQAGIPSGYLKVTGPGLTQPQADELKRKWLENHGNKRSIAVLNATTEFNPLSLSPVDAELVATDDMVLRMVAHAFNLSATALDSGAGKDNTYANITDQRSDRLVDTLLPWKRAEEQAVTAVLPYGTWAERDSRGYLQADPIKRTEYYAAMAALGAIQVSEIRDLERFPPMPEPAPEPAPPALEVVDDVSA